LSEYVEAERHDRFLQRLGEGGFVHQSLSPRTVGKNRILIATRDAHARGHLLAPSITDGVPEAFHHVVLGCGTHVFGFRMLVKTKQAQFTATKMREVWNWLLSVACQYRAVPAIVAGDFNADPEDKHLTQLVKLGWERAKPGEGESSFGTNRLIDHVFMSPGLVRNTVAVCCDWRYKLRPELAGKDPQSNEKGKRVGPGTPDHAMVIVDID
jgi:hypothetical protein